MAGQSSSLPRRDVFGRECERVTSHDQAWFGPSAIDSGFLRATGAPHGAEAVGDKDLTAEVLAGFLDADMLGPLSSRDTHDTPGIGDLMPSRSGSRTHLCG